MSEVDLGDDKELCGQGVRVGSRGPKAGQELAHLRRPMVKQPGDGQPDPGVPGLGAQPETELGDFD